MPEHFLHLAKIRAPVKKMGGRGVSQGMWGEMIHSCDHCRPVDDAPDLAGVDPPAPDTDKQRIINLRHLVADRQPLPDGIVGSLTERNHPLFIAFTQYPHHSSVPIHIIDIQATQLRHTHPGGIEQFEHGGITPKFILTPRDGIAHKLSGLGCSENSR